MRPRIYTYKITFEEVPFYYYGSHMEKRYGEYYMGSPVTNRWCWKFYTPKKQILEIFDTREEANIVENRLIKPFLSDPNCLNKNCGGIISSDMCRKGTKVQIENKLGLHSRTREQIIIDGDKGRETQKRLGLGFYNLPVETRRENGKKQGQKNIETGHIQRLGKTYGKICYENQLGFFATNENERYNMRSKGGKISGNNAYKNKTGIHAFTKDERIIASSKGGQKNIETGHIQRLGTNQIKKINSKLWKCLVTGHTTTAGPLTNYQKSRGIDVKLRIEVV